VDVVTRNHKRETRNQKPLLKRWQKIVEIVAWSYSSGSDFAARAARPLNRSPASKHPLK
jgi:hypothetical protein